MDEITPLELSAKLQRGDDFDLIDVREQQEWNIAHIPGARLIPMSRLADEIDSLDPEREIVVMCRSGARSGQVVRALAAEGFRNVKNLAGGILRWSDEVDPTVRKY